MANGEGESRGEVVLPSETVEELGQQVAGRVSQTIIEAREFSGPLPPPEMLAEYERALPGCAERIVKMVETEGDHRRECETRIVRADIRLSHIGQVMALVIALSALALAGLLLYDNKKIGGLASLIIGLGTLAGVFFYARRQPPSALGRPQDGESTTR
jgi:uncharacterized membrane protein